MTEQERIKYSYELMVKNNPDEAVKQLIMLDKEHNILRDRIAKAIEYIHNHQIVFELSSKKQIQEWFEKEYYVELLDILRGKDENNSI